MGLPPSGSREKELLTWLPSNSSRVRPSEIEQVICAAQRDEFAGLLLLRKACGLHRPHPVV